MKKLAVGTVIISLLGFNILFLYQNISLRNQLTQFESGKYIKVSTLNIRITHPSVAFSDNGMTVEAFFSDQGCRSCIEHEVQKLNSLFSHYREKIQVYLMSHNKSYLRRLFGATFPYEVISHRKSIFNVEFELTNPVIVLTDSNGTVRYFYMAEEGAKEKSNQFYQDMNSYFDSQ